jgi:hypothetical protein
MPRRQPSTKQAISDSFQTSATDGGVREGAVGHRDGCAFTVWNNQTQGLNDLSLAERGWGTQDSWISRIPELRLLLMGNSLKAYRANYPKRRPPDAPSQIRGSKKAHVGGYVDAIGKYNRNVQQ